MYRHYHRAGTRMYVLLHLYNAHQFNGCKAAAYDKSTGQHFSAAEVTAVERRVALSVSILLRYRGINIGFESQNLSSHYSSLAIAVVR